MLLSAAVNSAGTSSLEDADVDVDAEECLPLLSV